MPWQDPQQEDFNAWAEALPPQLGTNLRPLDVPPAILQALMEPRRVWDTSKPPTPEEQLNYDMAARVRGRNAMRRPEEGASAEADPHTILDLPIEPWSLAKGAASLPLMIGAPLWKNKAWYPVLQNSLAKTIGKQEAKGWTSLAKDVPEEYGSQPALGMLKELYDRFGFLKRPEEASKFGLEMEFASPLHANYWKERMKPNFTTTIDDSIRTHPGYKKKVEIGSNPYVQGYEQFSELRDMMKPLNELDPVTGMPLAISGPHVGGGHTNISWNDMTTDDVRKLAEIWMRNEPFVYPTMPIGNMENRLGWAEPMPELIKKMMRLGSQSEYERMFFRPGPWNLEDMGNAAREATPGQKFWSMNLRNLSGVEPGAERVEFRFPHGTLNPNDWIKNIIPAEIWAQEAKTRAHQGTWFPRDMGEFAKIYEDYLQANRGRILQSRPRKGYNTETDPWPDILEPGYMTRTRGPNRTTTPAEEMLEDLGMTQDRAGNWGYTTSASDEDALDVFAREIANEEAQGRRSLLRGM